MSTGASVARLVVGSRVRRLGRPSPQPRPPRRPAGRAVGGRTGNPKLDLGTDTDPAADIEPSSDDRRALAHARQPEVTGRLLPPHRLRVHALPVVADRHAKLPRLVVDRDVDLARLRVLDRVAERLARNSIRFVADDGIEIAGLADDVDLDCRRIRRRRIVCRFAPTPRCRSRGRSASSRTSAGLARRCDPR